MIDQNIRHALAGALVAIGATKHDVGNMAHGLSRDSGCECIAYRIDDDMHSCMCTCAPDQAGCDHHNGILTALVDFLLESHPWTPGTDVTSRAGAAPIGLIMRSAKGGFYRSNGTSNFDRWGEGSTSWNPWCTTVRVATWCNTLTVATAAELADAGIETTR